ncbi:tetratricopeptide repeat protein [Aspergillus melleus]|uniref:tetratricopeptide repeat protein n=1 Tax=Aspergillus melleus TaxID=138277 RepID=UPI001E8E466E|nr:uncharacterized protein LDX57_001514 [Aspergillus melleus]KAH8423758.1 hypothetical protein LDX57_001514 [Aspergillus melleus]
MNAFSHAVMLLYDLFPKQDGARLYNAWHMCGEYEKQVLDLLKYFLKMKDTGRLTVPWQLCDLLNHCQRFLHETNRLMDLMNLSELNTIVLQAVRECPEKKELKIANMIHQASVAEVLGNPKRAIELLNELYELELQENPVNHELLCRLSTNLGCCYNTANDHETALEWFQRARDIWPQFVGNRGVPTVILKNSGRCMLYLNDLEGARKNLDKCIFQLEKTKSMNRAVLAYAYFALATLEQRERNFEMAELYFITAKRSWLSDEQSRLHPFHGGCLYKIGACCLDQGKVQAAIKYLRNSVEVTNLSKDCMPVEHARSLFKLSKALLQVTKVDSDVNASEVESLRNEAQTCLKMRTSDVAAWDREETCDNLIPILWR